MKSVILILILFLLKYLLLEGRNCFLFKKLRRKKILQYIDVSEIVQFVKAAIMVISVHLKISTFFVVSHVLSAKVSPEWRLNPGFRTKKTCPFPLNRGVPSIQVTDIKIMWTSFPDQILCPLYMGLSLKVFSIQFFRRPYRYFPIALEVFYPCSMAMKFLTLTDFGLFK